MDSARLPSAQPRESSMITDIAFSVALATSICGIFVIVFLG